MSTTLNWISANPSAFASLVSAIIAASVALAVFANTQLLTQKRERTKFLTPKLEELYLLLNKVAHDNATLFKLLVLSLNGDKTAREQIMSMDELELYGHRTAKQLIMYIRLYFPKLAVIHPLLFRAQAKLNGLIYELHSETPPNLAEVVSASGRVSHFIRLMEEEIIDNRDYLLEDHFLPRKYKHSSPEKIEAENPPPDGPIIS